ncbi:hypothetical protein [Variovorax sp. 54]|uniref:hypothetical protein n=1 Tax=Variovorax sp. 54 TaxID=2035212 RepID=UPI000C1798FD|nr:hypothetical protein [Variovorax sp. 54]
MTKTEVLATAVEMTRAGLGFTPAAALEHIAELIERENAESALHDGNAEELLRLAACISGLRRGVFLPAVPYGGPGTQAQRSD